MSGENISSSVSNIWVKATGMKQVSHSDPVSVSYKSDERVWKVQFPDLKKVWDNALSESFLNCYNLVSVGLESLHTVDKYGMQRCFGGCTALSTVTENYTIPVYEVKDNGFEYTFFNCYKLPELHFPNLQIVGKHSFAYAFRKCAELKTVTFPKLEVCERNTFTSAFYQCYGLKNVSFPELKEVRQDGFQNAFNSCASLQKFVLKNIRKLEEDSFRSAFRNCDNIKYIILYNPDNEYEFSGYAFRNAFADDSNVTFISPLETYTTEHEYPPFLDDCGVIDVKCLYRNPKQEIQYVIEKLPKTDSAGYVVDAENNVITTKTGEKLTIENYGRLLDRVESDIKAKIIYTDQQTQKIAYTYHYIQKASGTIVYRLRDDTYDLILDV